MVVEHHENHLFERTSGVIMRLSISPNIPNRDMNQEQLSNINQRLLILQTMAFNATFYGPKLAVCCRPGNADPLVRVDYGCLMLIELQHSTPKIFVDMGMGQNLLSYYYLEEYTSIKSQRFLGPLWKTKSSLGVPALMLRRHLRLERSDASAGIPNRFSPKELGNSAAERRSSATHFWRWGLSTYPLVMTNSLRTWKWPLK